MKQIRIKYAPRELWGYFKKAVRRAFWGLFDIVWAIALLIINAALWVWNDMVHFIKARPVPSVLITFAVMLIMNIVVRASMKYKLSTSEWKRFQLEQKLDSMKAFDKGSLSCFRYEPYKLKE